MGYLIGSRIDLTRAGETERPSMRTDRLYRADGHWYIRTRESQDIGPYSSYREVTRTIPLFIDFASKLSSERVEALIENHNSKIEKRSHEHEEQIPEKPAKKAPFDNRIFAIKDTWFYKTPGGRKLGPYKSRNEAQKVSALFADYSKSLSEERIIELHDKYIFSNK